MWDWDDDKRASNLAKHGVDFAAALAFEWNTALTAEDSRQDYGERRHVSIGFIGDRLHVLVWTEREACFRIISLRKANAREIKRYADQI
ncbi:BrnT family toxin [Magnetospirillum sp. 15-1]|uniref:BrnT family toxin n=1 Tax=Magnetospirillum sp. 15-1 TaxID=1979370 RepID=UPI000BBC5D69|nr:BrnT family toxin [Magnetospirillum sp. 15-1]